MLFGRAQEEIAALEEAGVDYQVVPGITAALAASADLGISLTRRGLSRSVAFAAPRISPGEAENDWVQSVIAADTFALYMASGEAEEISTRLMGAGKAAGTPVAVVENASLPNARIIFSTLSNLPNDMTVLNLEGPALILLSEVYRRDADAAVEEIVAKVRLVARS